MQGIYKNSERIKITKIRKHNNYRIRNSYLNMSVNINKVLHR